MLGLASIPRLCYDGLSLFDWRASMPDEKKEIKVTFPPKLHGGVYANNMMVAHTREEFIMDFLMVAPPEGAHTPALRAW